IWMGIVGVFAVPMLSLRKVPAFRILASTGLAIAALLWAITGYAGYWGHVEPFSKWQPAHVKYEQELQQAAPMASPMAAPQAPAGK
ncbi:MAG TPA: DUF981 family protein, partial [bacterium]|nr:DUF981 family protein [bacterium]